MRPENCHVGIFAFSQVFWQTNSWIPTYQPMMAFHLDGTCELIPHKICP